MLVIKPIKASVSYLLRGKNKGKNCLKLTNYLEGFLPPSGNSQDQVCFKSDFSKSCEVGHPGNLPVPVHNVTARLRALLLQVI